MKPVTIFEGTLRIDVDADYLISVDVETTAWMRARWLEELDALADKMRDRMNLDLFRVTTEGP